ncbi:hypothetical protein A3462_18865 [Enterobacter bugandensis]|nr:hypothetical protein A3462_18865 [Enterobacter bugandensis]
MEVSEEVKWGFAKLEGATQKMRILGADLGAVYSWGPIWGRQINRYTPTLSLWCWEYVIDIHVSY